MASMMSTKPSQVHQGVVVDVDAEQVADQVLHGIGPRVGLAEQVGPAEPPAVQLVGDHAEAVAAVPRRPAAGCPGGTGNSMRLRGMPNRAVHPVAGSMETTIMVSVRMPRRPTPESPPSSRMFSRPSSGKAVGQGGGRGGGEGGSSSPSRPAARDRRRGRGGHIFQGDLAGVLIEVVGQEVVGQQDALADVEMGIAGGQQQDDQPADGRQPGRRAAPHRFGRRGRRRPRRRRGSRAGRRRRRRGGPAGSG